MENYKAFRPFCVIGSAEKIQADRATLLAIFLLWLTQVWFPQPIQLLENTPLFLPQNSPILPQDVDRIHPRPQKLVLTAMLLSGNPLKTKAYHQQMPSFYSTHGEEEHGYNMGLTSKEGCQFVSRGKLICFNHLSISCQITFRVQGISCSSMNNLRSGILAITTIGRMLAGQHPLVWRFMKAVS